MEIFFRNSFYPMKFNIFSKLRKIVFKYNIRLWYDFENF